MASLAPLREKQNITTRMDVNWIMNFACHAVGLAEADNLFPWIFDIPCWLLDIAFAFLAVNFQTTESTKIAKNLSLYEKGGSTSVLTENEGK